MLARSKRKALYDLSFKLKVVKWVEEKTKEAAACEFKVDPCRICVWCQQKKLFDLKKQGKSTRKQLEGEGHKADDEEMDVLFAWIVDLRGRNLRVLLKTIQAKAKELSQLQRVSQLVEAGYIDS